MRNPVTFLKCKYDGSVKRERTGDLVDAVGDWLVVYHSPALHTHLLHGEPVITGDSAHALFYLNTRLPLTVGFAFDQGGALEVAGVDAALPATREARAIRWVDLDLDIVIQPGSPAWVKDIEDFEQRRRELAYPPIVVSAAWEGIRIGAELIGGSAYPFDGSAAALLGRVMASMGPL